MSSAPQQHLASAVPSDDLPDTILTGTLHAYVAFDWGEEVDLKHACQLVPAVVHDLPRVTTFQQRIPPALKSSIQSTNRAPRSPSGPPLAPSLQLLLIVARNCQPVDDTMAGKNADKKRWVRNVKTVSTFPPAGLFTRDAKTIARVMASRKVSPKGPESGIRMIQFFINRAGKNLPVARRKELEEAKRLLRERTHRHE